MKKKPAREKTNRSINQILGFIYESEIDDKK